MAEILLSLTIIGVVAAITLPSLTGNINERTWNTQRKALFARMSQAIALMPALNGYGPSDSASAINSAAETFITSGLSKVLKINNICDNEHVFDCGLASKITTNDASTISLPLKISALNSGIPENTEGRVVYDTKAAAFETVNGESILTFYNPNCTSSGVLVSGQAADGTSGYYMKQHVCANFIYDLNGSKGPNTVGKDIGIMSVLYSSDPVVVLPYAPRKLTTAQTHSNAAKECSKLDDDYRLPNIEELISMYYNANLFNWAGDTGLYTWSSSVVDSSNAWAFGNSYGIKYSLPKNTARTVQCIKR
ncbi:MAG: hypothetical protein NC390_06960 [Fusobacterium sp.]|nr:hypothetical protein [Fusobacterium sp.]